MPWTKRILVGFAILAGLTLLGAGGVAVASGHHPAGGLLLAVTLLGAVAALEAFWVRWDLMTGSLRRGRRDRREVALTFDDGPGPDTPAVLDALDRVEAKATFFVLGRRAIERPDLVREVARRGHLVALHGHTHRTLHLAAPAEIAREIDEGAAAIRAAGVEPAPYFRAPHGWKGPLLGRELRRRGYTLVGWTRGVWDTERPGAAAIAERGCDRIRAGDILLLHDGACGTPGVDPRRDQTAAAIPEIVRRCRGEGLEPVTLGALQPGGGRIGGARALRIAGLALFAGLAAFALRDLDLHRVREAFARVRMWPIAAAVLANLAAMVAQGLRWYAVARPVAPLARPRDAVHATISGFMVGLVMPARVADLAKVHLLARRSRASMAPLAATVALDHLVGVATLVLLVGVAALFAPLPPWAQSAAYVFLIVAAGAGAAAFLLRPSPALAAASGRVALLVAKLRSGLVGAGQPRVLLLSALAGMAGWFLEVAIAALALAAFGLPATAHVAVLVTLATSLASAISLSPGNAGVFEAAVVLALAGFGVPAELALAYALGYHAVHVVPVALVGGLFALSAGDRRAVAREAP